MSPFWKVAFFKKQVKALRKGMDFHDLAKHSFKANFGRNESYVKPLKPRTRGAVSHKFSLANFKTVELCDIGSISLKSFIFSVTRRHSDID